MGNKKYLGVIGRAIAQEEAREKPCGFEDKPCVRKCIYYNTCTRNPYRYAQRKE